MTEQVPPTGIEERETEQTSPQETDLGGPTTTGVPAVDRVLADVDALADLPLEEHLDAFERAHESLRAALDQPSDEPAAGSGDRSHQPGDPA